MRWLPQPPRAHGGRVRIAHARDWTGPLVGRLELPTARWCTAAIRCISLRASQRAGAVACALATMVLPITPLGGGRSSLVIAEGGRFLREVRRWRGEVHLGCAGGVAGTAIQSQACCPRDCFDGPGALPGRCLSKACCAHLAIFLLRGSSADSCCFKEPLPVRPELKLAPV